LKGRTGKGISEKEGNRDGREGWEKGLNRWKEIGIEEKDGKKGLDRRKGIGTEEKAGKGIGKNDGNRERD
jgi:hypothetical protein